MSSDDDHIKWFRASSPYINAHRGKTFVIHLAGKALLDANFGNVINDIALLYSLGVKLVLVFGATPQIEASLDSTDKQWPQSDQVRVTAPDILGDVLSAIGRTGTELEAKLSMGRSPMQGLDILVTSGNFIKAKPLGIVNGIDFHHTGATRRVNSKAIKAQLAGDAIVVVPPIGYSPSGETFVLSSRELARDIACALVSEKLIYLSEDDGIRSVSGDIINELQENQLDLSSIDPAHRDLAELTARASLRGVNRCHIISFKKDGALLNELFTRDGAGTQVIRESYEKLRAAGAEDVAGIIALIEPLETAGILVKRSRELLESEIDHFRIIERDSMIVACAALYPFGTKGELACLATHPDYRNGNRGELLLQTIESTAKSLGLDALFVLTTQTAHWFLDRGFAEQSVDVLPAERKSLYNLQRSSKLLIKDL
jgi:amino-acid N-acetyltransferase